MVQWTKDTVENKNNSLAFKLRTEQFNGSYKYTKIEQFFVMHREIFCIDKVTMITILKIGNVFQAKHFFWKEIILSGTAVIEWLSYCILYNQLILNSFILYFRDHLHFNQPNETILK